MPVSPERIIPAWGLLVHSLSACTCKVGREGVPFSKVRGSETCAGSVQQSECWALQVRREEGTLVSEARAKLQASVQQQVHGEEEALLAQARAAAAEARAKAEPGPSSAAEADHAGGCTSQVSSPGMQLSVSSGNAVLLLTGQGQEVLPFWRKLMAPSASHWREPLCRPCTCRGIFYNSRRREGYCRGRGCSCAGREGTGQAAEAAAAEEACCAAAGTQQLAGDSLTCTLPFAVVNMLHGGLFVVLCCGTVLAGTSLLSSDHTHLLLEPVGSRSTCLYPAGPHVSMRVSPDTAAAQSAALHCRPLWRRCSMRMRLLARPCWSRHWQA